MKIKRILLLSLIIFCLLLVNINVCEAKFSCSCYEFRKIVLQYPPKQGDDIWELQRELKELGFYKKRLNSLYDWNTYLAVKRFQYAYNLAGDGLVTNELWLKLGIAIHGEDAVLVNKIKPPQGEVVIIVNTYQRKLIVYSNGKKYAQFPVAIGKATSRSPIGEFKIIEKVDMWDGSAFGDKWMRLSVPWGNYGIHGTNKPGSVGYAASNGCIRLFNHHIDQLYSWVQIGTKVKIIGYREPIKINRFLKPNDRGKDVLLLQEKLRKHGFKLECTDGIFGTETKETIKKLKYIYGLNDDIIADENIFYILNIK